MFKKLFSATAIYALAPQLPKLVSFIMLPILTSNLTANDYGINGIILAYVAAFDAFKDLGLNVIVTNTFFKYPAKYVFIWKRILGFLQVWSIIYGVLLIPLILLVTPVEAFDNVFWIVLSIILPVMFFEPISNIGRHYFQLNKKPVSFVTISVSSSLLTILVNYITIVHFQLGYLGFLIGNLVAAANTFLIYFYLVYIKFKIIPSLKFSYKWIIKKLKITLPTIPHFYAGYLLNVSDRVLLSLFHVSTAEIGLYSFAYSIGTYFSILGKSYWQASGPFYMEYYRKENQKGDVQARKMTYYVQAGILLLAFLLSLWIKELFGFLARNEELRSSYYIAIPIIMAYTYHPAYAFNSMKLWYYEKTKTLMKISVVAGVLSVCLNLLLIPVLGVFGSAIATFVSYMYMGYGGFLFKDIRSLFVVNFLPVIWLFVTLSLSLIVYFLKDIDLNFKILITVLCFIVFILSLLKYKNR